jgi:NADPH:quinone reductase-like Zn-dependent oxidoreductase
MSNRAVVLQKWVANDPDAGLALVTKHVPKAEPGQVVVHIILRPVNPTDLLSLRTPGNAHAKDGSFTPGSEGVGIVHEVSIFFMRFLPSIRLHLKFLDYYDKPRMTVMIDCSIELICSCQLCVLINRFGKCRQVGEGVTTVLKGQRVVPFVQVENLRKGQGTWQEYVAVRGDLVWVVPDSISDVAAAQFVINPWTVHGMLSDLQIPKGEYVLQTAAGSALGRQLIKLAKHWDIKTINLVRRKEQKEELKALGADEVIATNDEDVVTRVKEITGGKLAYGALDAVAGELTKQVCASVRDGGQVFVYGVLAGWDATVGVGDLFRGVHLAAWRLYGELLIPERRRVFIHDVSKLIEDKIIEPNVGETYDLANFQLAIKKSEEVGRGGKVYLKN